MPPLDRAILSRLPSLPPLTTCIPGASAAHARPRYAVHTRSAKFLPMKENKARILAILPLSLLLAGCGEDSIAQSEDDVRAAVESVLPEVERAVGLPFVTTPAVAIRSREQMRSYVDAKIAEELPPEEIERLTVAYRLFGLIPDTLDLAALLSELYAEQVVGYYEPDSSTLYVVDDADPTIARLTIAHELVHALQDQYMSLDSILSVRNQNDRVLAAQAILEGQATLGSMLAVMPGQDADAFGNLWTDVGVRQMMSEQQQRMPVFAAAPRIIKEGLIFPYLAGADFVRWFSRAYPDTVPFGSRLPASTEHILQPEQYRAGDWPVALSFVESEVAVYTDDLGQFETQLLLAEWTGNDPIGVSGATGWAGDRYAVFETGGDYALVWWTVWDDQPAADRFFAIVSRDVGSRQTDGHSRTAEQLEVGGRPAVLYAFYPEGWERAQDLPRVMLN